MSWLLRYRLRRFVKYSFWFYPSLALIGAWVLARAIVDFVPNVDLRIFRQDNSDSASAVIGALAASMMTFIVYAVSALLLAVQLASGQITPRLISLTFGRWSVKASTSIFVFSFCLALVSLGNAGSEHPHNVLLSLAVLSNMLSVIVFFWFVEAVGTGSQSAQHHRHRCPRQALRPVTGSRALFPVSARLTTLRCTALA